MGKYILLFIRSCNKYVIKRNISTFANVYIFSQLFHTQYTFIKSLLFKFLTTSVGQTVGVVSGSKFVISDSIIQIGDDDNSYLFSKPIKIIIENENRTIWLVQRTVGNNFYEVKGCSNQALSSQEMECFYLDGANLVILSNHATIFAPANGVPSYKAGGGGNKIVYTSNNTSFVNLRKVKNENYSTQNPVSTFGLRGKLNTNLTLQNQKKRFLNLFYIFL